MNAACQQGYAAHSNVRLTCRCLHTIKTIQSKSHINFLGYKRLHPSLQVTLLISECDSNHVMLFFAFASNKLAPQYDIKHLPCYLNGHSCHKNWWQRVQRRHSLWTFWNIFINFKLSHKMHFKIAASKLLGGCLVLPELYCSARPIWFWRRNQHWTKLWQCWFRYPFQKVDLKVLKQLAAFVLEIFSLFIYFFICR